MQEKSEVVSMLGHSHEGSMEASETEGRSEDVDVAGMNMYQ